MMSLTTPTPRIVGEPEVVEDACTAETGAAWLDLKAAATELQTLQSRTAASRMPPHHPQARDLVDAHRRRHPAISPPRSRTTPSTSTALVVDFERWADGGLRRPRLPRLARRVPAAAAPRRRPPPPRRVPDVHAERHRRPPRRGAARRGDLARVHRASSRPATTRNKLFVLAALRRLHARLRHQLGGAVPRDRRDARDPDVHVGRDLRRTARPRASAASCAAAAEITKLDLPADAARMLDDQALTEETFVMWDIIHDRTHMRGDLPFDPFMIKQRMPYFLYSLEELRCDLTAFRECVATRRAPTDEPDARDPRADARQRLVQYAVIFDRIFRFAITGTRVRNYDGLGGQLLFAWLHQHDVLHWTDTALAFDWDERAGGRGRARRRDRRAVLALDRPAEDRALARGVRAGARHARRRTRRRRGRAGCPTRSSPDRRRATPTPCSTTSSRCRCSTRRWAGRWATSSSRRAASRAEREHSGRAAGDFSESLAPRAGARSDSAVARRRRQRRRR